MTSAVDSSVAQEMVNDAQKAWNTMDVAVVRCVAWLAIPPISKIINEQATQSRPFYEVIRPYLNSSSSKRIGAALVCGDMQGERSYFQTLGFSRVDGFDISDVSLNRADLSDCEFSFHPSVADCNTLTLTKGIYDLVIGHHGLHHIWDLPHLFSEMHGSLKPGGLIAFYEWIGPRFLQIPRSNKVVCWILLKLLFKPQQRMTHMGRFKGRKWLQDPPESFDPSEACHSEILWEAYTEKFRPLHSAKFGGLMYPMFEGLGANDDLLSDPKLNWKIGVVAFFERTLTCLGLIRPLFAFTVGRAK